MLVSGCQKKRQTSVSSDADLFNNQSSDKDIYVRTHV